MPNSGEKVGKNGNRGSNGEGHQPLNFANRLISSIPHGRKGKHNLIVAKILSDLEQLAPETAILVPLDGMNGEKIENVRSALNRATKQKKISVATSTDDKYFYVWRTQVSKSQAATAPEKIASGSRGVLQ